MEAKSIQKKKRKRTEKLAARRRLVVGCTPEEKRNEAGVLKMFLHFPNSFESE